MRSSSEQIAFCEITLDATLPHLREPNFANIPSQDQQEMQSTSDEDSG